MSRRKNKTKMLLYFIAIAVALVLILVLLLFQSRRTKKIAESTIRLEQADRTVTISNIGNAKDIVRYELSACLSGDLDKALRGCAADELATGTDVEAYINNGNVLNRIWTSVPPASENPEYGTLGKAELMQNFAGAYEELTKQWSKDMKVTVESVDYLRPEYQVDEKNWDSMLKESELYSAKCILDMMALLDVEGETYMTSFRVIQFPGGSWKFLDMRTSLEVESGQSYITPITRNEYQQLRGEKAAVELESRIDQQAENEIAAEDMLLPYSYTLTENRTEQSAEDTIYQFFTNMEAKDMNGMLSYFEKPNPQDIQGRVAVDYVKRQGDCARQIQQVYYFVSKTYDAKTGAQAILSADLSKIVSLHCERIDYQPDQKNYMAGVRYGGEYYRVLFDMVQEESGWKIRGVQAI